MQLPSAMLLMRNNLNRPSSPARLEFDQFVRDNLELVRKVAASKVGPDQADDVACETFVAAWQRRQAHPDATLDRAWLAGTAINLCRMNGRSERQWHRQLRRAELAMDYGQGDQFDADVIDRIDAVNASSRLLHGFATLTESERDVIALVAWAGLTPAEVADALELPGGTVRSHLHRARQRLAAALTPNEAQP